MSEIPNSMPFTRILIFTGCCLLFATCRTCSMIETRGDTTPPKLTAYLFNLEADAVPFRSTDPNIEVARNCATSSGYFADLNNSTLDVGVMASDRGGIDNMAVRISPVRRQDIRNARAINNPDLVLSIVQTDPLEVTISADFTNRLTGQIIKFDVMGVDSVLLIDAEAEDLLLHRSAFIQSGVSSAPGRVLHSSLCPDN